MYTSESKTLFGMVESITFCGICLQGKLQLVAMAVQLGIWFENTSLRVLSSHITGTFLNTLMITNRLGTLKTFTAPQWHVHSGNNKASFEPSFEF